MTNNNIKQATKNLTLQHLKDMQPGIFAYGTLQDCKICPEHIKWVAVRGGIHDWTIYYDKECYSYDHVKDFGTKLYTSSIIRELVPCDDKAFKMYRY